MFKATNARCLYAIIILCSLVPSTAWSKILPPFDIQLEPTSPPPKGGSFGVALSIAPRCSCDTLEVTVRTIGSIAVSGPHSWSDVLGAERILERSLRVTIPDNDTTGFEVGVRSGKIRHHAFLYFVTTGDSARVFRGDPRYEPVMPPATMVIKVPAVDSLNALRVQRAALDTVIPSIRVAEAPLGPPSSAARNQTSPSSPLLPSSLSGSCRGTAADRSREWRRRTRPIVEIQVDVSTLGAARSLFPHITEAGTFEITLAPESLLVLKTSGIPYHVLGSELLWTRERAIPPRGESLRLRSDALGETSWDLPEEAMQSGDRDETVMQRINDTDVTIPDDPPGPGVGSAWSQIAVSDAPSGSVLTRLQYLVVINHTWVGDLYVELNNGTHYLLLWDEYGASTDFGNDDDYANDDDIELIWRETGYFNNDAVNDTWTLYVEDHMGGDTGYIDTFGLRLYYQGQALPNLLPYAPSGWDYPVVPSRVTGTHEVSTLYGDETTYIDWCVRNAGQGDASTFHTALYIDNNFITSWVHASGLGSGNAAAVEDYARTLSAGNHTLKIVTDYLNEVTEVSETDNTYSRQFYWENPTVTVTGWIRYHDHNPQAARDARGVKVEVWDDDDVLPLWTGHTGDDGTFASSAIPNSEPGGGRQDIYVRVWAENDAASVRDGLLQKFALVTEPVQDVPNGSFNIGTIFPPAEADGAFFIADQVLLGYEKWASVRPSDDLDQVTVVWTTNAGGTGYNQITSLLYVDADNDPGNLEPDTFDADVILHEVGHRLEDLMDFFDDPLIVWHEHYWTQDGQSPQFAAEEGFATAWSCYVRSGSRIYNCYNDFQEWVWVDVETGGQGGRDLVPQGPQDWENPHCYGDLGDDSEASIAGALWDMVDLETDDTYPLGAPDGIGDGWSGDIGDVLSVVADRIAADGQHPDTMEDLWTTWFASPSMGHSQEMWAIWHEHGEQEMDQTPPTGSVQVAGGAATTTSLVLNLNLGAADDLSGMLPGGQYVPGGQMRFSNDPAQVQWSGWEPYATVRNGWDLASFGGTSGLGLKTVYVKFADAEGNESQIAQDQILYAVADLVVESVQVNPGAVQVGGNTAASCVIRNEGNVAAGPSVLAYYLSDDGSYSSESDVSLGTDAVGSIGAGATSPQSKTLTIPMGTAPGSWFILFYTDFDADGDGSVTELHEDNNVGSVEIVVTSVPKPDLVVESEAATPNAVQTGGTTVASCIVRNQGNAAADPCILRYYISDDDSHDGDDVSLGYDVLAAIGAGGTSPQSEILTIPLGTPAGTWFVLFYADNDEAVPEASETNNVGHVQITVTSTPQPDLVVESPALSPVALLPGLTTIASCVVKNQGNATAGSSVLGYYLSDDDNYDSGSDLCLGTDAVDGLAAGGTSSESETLTIPPETTPGSWFILFYADQAGGVAEADEQNNIQALQIVVTATLDPDLVVEDATAGPTTMQAGSSTTVSCEVLNQGNGNAAQSTLRYYLSSNQDYESGSDQELGSDDVEALSGGCRSPESEVLTIPAGTALGTWFILLRADADDQVNEGAPGETNNVSWVQLTVIGMPSYEWVIETVDGLDAGRHLSIATDGACRPHVCYQRGTRLEYAWRGPSGWDFETVDTQNHTPEYTSIAVGAGGYPHISYYDLDVGDLIYTYKDASGWHLENVHASGDLGRYSSLALDTNGYPHISYYHTGDADLMYAFKDGAGWHTQTVDSEGSVGKYTSLELDGTGYPHISYQEATSMDLKYAYQDGSGWHIQVVDAPGDNVEGTSLDLSSSGYPYIAYSDDGDDDLMLAYRDGAGWHVQAFDTDGQTGIGVSLVLDTTDRPHVSYLDYDNFDLRYAYQDVAGLHLATVDASGDFRMFTALALDVAGYAHIVYYDNSEGDLKYAYQSAPPAPDIAVTPASLTFEVHSGENDARALTVSNTGNATLTIDSISDDAGWLSESPPGFDVGGGGSQAVTVTADASGLGAGTYSATITITSNDPDENPATVAVTLNVQASEIGVTPTSLSFKLSLEETDTLALHLENTGNDTLHVLSITDDVDWLSVAPSTFEVDENSVEDVEAVANAAGLSAGMYYGAITITCDDPDEGTVTIAVTLEVQAFLTDWVVETVDAQGDAGKYLSIAVDQTGYPHVCYRRGGALMYARAGAAGWTLETVDTQGNTAEYTSLAIGSDGVPRISFYDLGDGDLIYAYKDGSGWHVETVRSSGDVGRYSSLALDGDDHAHIGFYSTTENDLDYAYQDGTGWLIEIVDSEGDVGRYASVDLDPLGNPHISYQEAATSQNLKYAHRDGAGWHILRLDTPGDAVAATSLRVSNTGFPGVAYLDDIDSDLLYTYQDATGWHLVTVDAAGSKGVSPSLAFDATDYPHICYFDYDTYDIKYAYESASGWEAETADAEGGLRWFAALALDASGCPHLAYYDFGNEDLKYAYKPTPPVVSLSGQLVGGQVQLSWSPVSQASAYWVYGASNLPWFTPGVDLPHQYRLVVLPSTATSWSSSGGVGDPTTNWTYLVIAINASEQELCHSNRVGEHEFLGDIP